MRRTKVICQHCGAVIPAITTGMLISYSCPSCGCEHSEKVEVDEEFFNRFAYNRHTDPYKSMLLPITYQCNETCRLCYAPKGDHRSVEWCLEQAAAHKSRRVFLSGGEPTVHPQLFDIISGMSNFSAILTNGKAFADEKFLNEYIAVAPPADRMLRACVSIHVNMPEYKHQMIDNVRCAGLFLDTAMFSIIDINELDELIGVWQRNRDVMPIIRIRTPFNAWKQSGEKTLFLSQVYNEFMKKVPTAQVIDALGGNSIFNVNLASGNNIISLCSAPSPTAMDIDACKNAPYSLAENGKIYPVPVAWVVNEYTIC